MNLFSKRLVVSGILVLACGSITLALTQAVSYKPWGVPDSRRDDYDRKVAELDRQASIRETYASKPRPQSSVSSTLHDFGWVTAGESLNHRFVIKNVGDVALELGIRREEADDIQVQLQHATVLPGESTSCQVDWTPSFEVHDRIVVCESEQTSKHQRIVVTTNDPLQPSLAFTVQCKQRADVVLPEQIDFGKHDLTDSSTARFVIYSQRNPEFQINDIRCQDHEVKWSVQPTDFTSEPLLGRDAVAAHEVIVNVDPKQYGHYSGELQFVFGSSSSEDLMALVPFGGRVRPPIGFYGPDVDSRTGVDFGTVQAGKRHDLFVSVRSRADKTRELEVLDVFPKELETELTAMETTGVYRLRVSVPADSPDLRFNLDEQHGYVQVGDPMMKEYSNWLPVYGCVAHTMNN